MAGSRADIFGLGFPPCVFLSVQVRRLPFPILFVEQVRVSAGVEHQQFQFVSFLLPYQQPVGLDVALPLALAVSKELMGMIDFGQAPVAFEQLDDGAEFIHRIATLDAALQILLELVGGGNLVSHQMPIFLKNSSLLS